MQKTIIFGFIILNLFFSCKQQEIKIIEKLRKNNQLLDDLKILAFKDTSLIAKYPNYLLIDKLQEPTKKQLEKIGFSDNTYIRLDHLYCFPTTEEYEINILFNNNWYLEFMPCGVKIITGQYKKENQYEWWGISNNWQIHVENQE